MTTDSLIAPMLPQDEVAEVAVLGSLLADGEALSDVAPLLRPSDFYWPKHAALYQVMLDVTARGEPLDAVVIFRECERRGLLEETGGREYIATLAAAVPSPAHAVHYAGIVREKARSRALIRATSDIQRAAYACSGRGDELLATAQARVLAVADAFDPPTEAGSLPATLQQALRDLCEAMPEGPEGGLSLGLPTLDKLGVRIGCGDYVVLSAPTGGGKSVLGMQVALGVAERLGAPVTYVTLDMAPAQILRRAIVARSSVRDPYGRGLGGLDREAAERAAAEIGALPFHVPYPVPDAIDHFLPWLRAHCRRTRPCLVVIDHIGLLHTGHRDLYTQATVVSQQLRQWALRGERIPILALAQLRRRDSNQQGATRPAELHDLKDSGSIENDATCVLMLDSPFQRASAADRLSGKISESELWLHVKKNRNGVVHVGVPLHFDTLHSRIRERDPHPEGFAS